MGKGELVPLDEFEKPIESPSIAVAVGLFLEPRIQIAVNHYTEGQFVVAADEIEKALDQQREVPSVSRA